MIHLKNEIKKHIFQMLIGVTVFVILIKILENVNSWLFISAPQELQNLSAQYNLLFPFLFVLIYVVASMLFLPTSRALIFTSGIMYGVNGIFLSLIAEMTSATVNYLLGREINLFFHPKRKVHFIKKYIKKHGFGLVFILKYLGFPFGIVSYAAGMAKIEYKKYMIATFFGFLPHLLVFVYLGNLLIDTQSSSFIYPLIIFKIVLYTSFIVGYGLNKK